MHATPRFFTLIIGTEILNGRRRDKHFDFVREELARYGYTLSGNFVIEDDPALIVQTLKFLASQPASVVFSFGGIGSTPDDHTRKAAAIALRDGRLQTHPEARKIITERLEKMQVPNPEYPLRMAELPRGAKLLYNPVNGMPAFYLDDRFFFMPGFPEMSHPMVRWALEKILHYRKRTIHRRTLTALSRESALIDLMENLPKGVDLSSLPRVYSDGPRVVLSLSGSDKKQVEEHFEKIRKALEERRIPYSLSDEHDASRIEDDG
ncbi:competence/damage-inducible protein A [Nitratifractor sp.]